MKNFNRWNDGDFPWDEFYERFVLNLEEFMFEYKNKEIHLSTAGYKEKTVHLAYGTFENGYMHKTYNSPKEFLIDKVFEGKTLSEIWDDIWPIKFLV